MLESERDDSEDALEYDELADAEPRFRPVKRRRIDAGDGHLASVDSEDDLEPTDGALSSSATEGRSPSDPGDGERQVQERDESKSKPKYKIHVPKYSELPRDVFLTQLPDHQLSPSQIGQFRWQKPPKSPAPIREENDLRQPMSHNSHVSTTSTLPKEDKLVHTSSTATRVIVDDRDEYDCERDYDDLLADLPSDAFLSPTALPKASHQDRSLAVFERDHSSQFLPQTLAAPLTNLRQTTLFGTATQKEDPPSQTTKKRNWPLASREEPPTHHKLNPDAMKTWVYPTNLGTIRDYQFSIVARGLYHNMLVALPTGLGKTFIAATIMLNWYRWTTNSQIVFVAPTRPLVSQQVKACFEITGMPRSATTMLTGGISPGLRAEEWQKRRVFFMTPQTIINDLKAGICDPKRLVLLVVDEAHRATGSYAYVEVVKFLRRFNTSFRVLALTATPGSSIESVQEVIDGLGISRVEIRTEESLDIRQYVHSRRIETILFDNSEEMTMVMDLYSKALQPVVNKLTAMNAYWARDPMTLTPYGCTQARQKWMASDAGRKASMPVKGMVNTIFTLLASLSHGIELLKFHGIGPFFHKVLAFRNGLQTGNQKGKYAQQINESNEFQTMMSRVQIWINTPEFVGHPKLEYLQSVVMNHFLDAGEGRGASDPSSTRIMVFSHYRDSAEEIARVLRRNEPMVRPHVFVGQANSKGSEGMDQKTQLEIIQKFKDGIYNTLVATSIGEEGLDIGEVDLIVCYDASASPIRMLQRMGRTGRKRAGNIVVTLMRGKEENNFVKAKDNYEKMQLEIASGARFNFHDEESRRILPRDIQPIVDKRIIDIPIENTQPDLPEPKKQGRPPKKPPKKFHMPDGVRTGFVKASRMDNENDGGRKSLPQAPSEKLGSTTALAIVPLLKDVLLTAEEERIFERRYQDVKGDTAQIIEAPRVDVFPSLQRRSRPTKSIGHGSRTRKTIAMLDSMHSMNKHKARGFEDHLSAKDRKAASDQIEQRITYVNGPQALRRSPVRSSSPFESPALGSLPSCHPKVADAIELSSCEDVLADSESLPDFLDDDMEDAASSTSSPPIPAKTGVRPYSSIASPLKFEDHSDSGSDLPDFGSLVHGVGRPERTYSRQRNHARNIIENDSDDG